MKYKKLMAIGFVVFVLFVSGSYIIYAVTVISIDENTPYRVERVLDGDTFMVKIGWHDVTIRMLGIDTPETVDPRKLVQCYGKEASDETKSLLTGQKVRLKLNPNREERDRYGRYLAYVYMNGANNLFVNEFLLENGYAHEYTYGKPYMYQKEFREIEKTAKEAGKGLWGGCEITSSKPAKL
ncbi:MAG: hypothetical protein A3C79_00320 [Candidatus Taylorbacteria bacterium RIFCSPHIGHO2_02_FULL_45_28]|uniref:TNase-like domain-containing protein n=1 Tax=Candidatus Taylorbacteria bacterium RIFCSPHIGHO2_12_FULL_45_16 TaxID=1802315 RepID=A0A1G2MZ28_9BACT|nr:MAG: hypothetical protein A2830_01575 [Candidatus Taylorbacteria bacterium RIFCSPHIGHO2_01_FULL_44_110]OHA25469.1 MAG: hypothetical protein A3C79_00320 [Candidatus Taylorbacteria bacterium RIFCSPHIGHO2_02_FULL_45_28]OHA29136.1 MAG: hypothetical protein A3F51_00785 [Candidatus Taylorbacteria bacterium RIFCSPHIGHO2_12_FULL_45_16]OHA33358.1 MAG: hypothetical protein A3A23_01665 [Candidatus Taylorbacteria bacterium RIFCSPLOWO2_01_FULL_45_59]OHA38730.1 MAG: hypothetical protein A3I98_03440 [Candi